MADSRNTMNQEENVLNRRELYVRVSHSLKSQNHFLIILLNIQKFSPDELRVLKECNYESFYFRSLPFGTALGALAYYGVKSGNDEIS